MCVCVWKRVYVHVCVCVLSVYMSPFPAAGVPLCQPAYVCVCVCDI